MWNYTNTLYCNLKNLNNLFIILFYFNENKLITFIFVGVKMGHHTMFLVFYVNTSKHLSRCLKSYLCLYLNITRSGPSLTSSKSIKDDIALVNYHSHFYIGYYCIQVSLIVYYAVTYHSLKFICNHLTNFFLIIALL